MATLTTKKIQQKIGKRLFNAREAHKAGVSNAMLAYYQSKGFIEKIHHGVYSIHGHDESADDTYYEFRYANAATKGKGIIGLISALNYHDLTDEIAHYVYVIIKSTTRFRASDKYFIVRSHDKKQSIGVDQKDGFKITNFERTIIDCFRYKHIVTLEVAYQALSEALAEKKLDMKKFMTYAKKFRIKNLVDTAVQQILCEQYNAVTKH
ncbi:MAG: hypothetical protein HQM16_15440 [Deltaproteobacteria bacterium]|nr:hypothetical protein [Deltaproteobacteria bacterium]